MGWSSVNGRRLGKTVGAAFTGVACVVLLVPPAIGQSPKPRSPLSLDAFEAAEVLLRDVCMAGKFDGKSIAELAAQQGALPFDAKRYGGGPQDRVFRLGPIKTQVYVVDWADGTCTTRVSGGGDAVKLRALAERIILARPEGFVRGAHAPEDGGRVTRTVYCAPQGAETLIISITSPGENAGNTAALSSTAYRSPRQSPLCQV